jgi:hypothetical protein
MKIMKEYWYFFFLSIKDLTKKCFEFSKYYIQNVSHFKLNENPLPIDVAIVYNNLKILGYII